MRYRTQKLLQIPIEHNEDLTQANLLGVSAYNNTLVTVEPLSHRGYNYVMASNKVFRVPVSWLKTKPIKK